MQRCRVVRTRETRAMSPGGDPELPPAAFVIGAARGCIGSRNGEKKKKPTGNPSVRVSDFDPISRGNAMYPFPDPRRDIVYALCYIYGSLARSKSDRLGETAGRVLRVVTREIRLSEDHLGALGKVCQLDPILYSVIY